MKDGIIRKKETTKKQGHKETMQLRARGRSRQWHEQERKWFFVSRELLSLSTAESKSPIFPFPPTASQDSQWSCWSHRWLHQCGLFARTRLRLSPAVVNRFAASDRNTRGRPQEPFDEPPTAGLSFRDGVPRCDPAVRRGDSTRQATVAELLHQALKQRRKPRQSIACADPLWRSARPYF